MTARCYIGADQRDESEKTYPSGAKELVENRPGVLNCWVKIAKPSSESLPNHIGLIFSRPLEGS